MPVIKLGFLLGLPLPESNSPPPTATDDKSESKSKDKKRKITKSTVTKTTHIKETNKLFTESETITKPTQRKEEKPKHVFEVDKPKGYFHIEYQLFSHLQAIHIDILHWDIISKIYFQSNVVIYKNLIKDHTIWIPIMLEHKINESLLQEDILALKNYVIQFVVSSNKKNMSAEAKTEKTKVFYIREEDIDCDCYVRAFDTDPNVRLESIQTNYGASENETTGDSVHAMNSIIKQFDDSLLHPRFQKILRKLESGEQITGKFFIPPSLPPIPEEFAAGPDENDVMNYTWPKTKLNGGKSKEKNKIDKKADKTKNSKSKKTGQDQNKNEKSATKAKKEAVIKVSGETYLTDATLATFRLNEEVENIKDLFVVLQTSRLSTPEMLIALHPLVVKIKSLRNLPIEFLIEEEIKSIYLQYNIPDIGRHVTQPIMLQDLSEKCLKSKKIKINESHVYFDVSIAHLSYFVTCDRLFIDLIGVYDEPRKPCPSLFGSLRSDFLNMPPKLNEIIPQRPESVLLAVACYDLSHFIYSRMDLEYIQPLRHPTNPNSQRLTSQFQNLNFTRPTTIEQVHLKYKRDPFPSPLIDGILFENDTSLKVQVLLGFQLQMFHPLGEPFVKYTRVLLIVYDLEIATFLLSDVLCYNEQFQTSVLINNYALYPERVLKVKEMDPRGQVLTGFVIDNGNSTIIFLESCSANYCMELILHQVKNMNESLCRTFYNSGIFWYHRIYENFLAFGGVLKITLKYELRMISSVKWSQMRNCVPKPTLEAMRKLNYMLEMQSITIMSQHAVFPTANELLSLDLEFGVPHINEIMY